MMICLSGLSTAVGVLGRLLRSCSRYANVCSWRHSAITSSAEYKNSLQDIMGEVLSNPPQFCCGGRSFYAVCFDLQIPHAHRAASYWLNVLNSEAYEYSAGE